MKPIQTIDIGQQVFCDLCNTEFSQLPDTGGILVQSKGVCPRCAPKFEADLVKYGEEHYIRARCPADMRFHDWILKIRDGDNTIRVFEMSTE